MRSQAEPGNEGLLSEMIYLKERGGASGYAFPGRAWERGISKNAEFNYQLKSLLELTSASDTDIENH